MKPTKEQINIFNYIEKRKENILIKAYAGTGKTTTIVNAAKLLPKTSKIIFLAFNKHIKDELKTKLPEHIKCYTTYSLGASAIIRKYGDKIKFDEFKIDKIINTHKKKWDLNDLKDEELEKYLNDIKKIVNLCRLTLTLRHDNIQYISDRYDIKLDRNVDYKRILKIIEESTNDRSTYDYTDMIYLPAIDNSIWMFPQDYVFVDEVQDLNRCQIKIIEKILKKDKVSNKYIGRLISVGDYYQGIYGFTAADDKSFEWFEKFPNTKVLPLSISFRCAKNIILKANEIVPDIKAHDDAIDGIVRNGSVLDEASDNDFVLCRTTMPLVRLFFQFLEKGKKALIKGSDIGIQLIDYIENIKDIKTLKEYWTKYLFDFRLEIINSGILNPNEHSIYSDLEDKINTLLFLSSIADDIEDLKRIINTIFKDDINGIILSTIHKSKGLESDRVFIIRPDLIPLPNQKGWQYAQEKNLEYVAITRSRKELIYDIEWTDL